MFSQRKHNALESVILVTCCAGVTYRKPFTLREADDNRDAFAKALYDTLFARVVDYVNEAATDNASENAVFCGVLDIFGFECFELNSLEQLCINYTNERLQSVFNDFVFESERKLYEREGIPWIPVMCVTNEQCLDFLDHRTVGFFALLEEECILPEPNDQRLLHKLGDKHKNHACFSAVPLFWRERFAVTHFAGRVLYDITGFTEKNSKRCSFGLHRAALQQSNKSFVRSLFQYVLQLLKNVIALQLFFLSLCRVLSYSGTQDIAKVVLRRSSNTV